MTNEPLSIIRQLELLRDLQRFANQRHASEQKIKQSQHTELEAINKQFEENASEIESAHLLTHSEAEITYEKSVLEADSTYATERERIQTEYQEKRDALSSGYLFTTEAARTQLEESSWQTRAVFDSEKENPAEQLTETQKQLQKDLNELAVLASDAWTIMTLRRQLSAKKIADHENFEPAPAQDPPPFIVAEKKVSLTAQAALRQVSERLAKVRSSTIELQQDKLSECFEDAHPAYFLIGGVGLMSLVCGFTMGWSNFWWIAAASLSGIVLGAGMLGWLLPRCRRKMGSAYHAIEQQTEETKQALLTAHQATVALCEHQTTEILQRHDAEIKTAENLYQHTMATVKAEHEKNLSTTNEKYPKLLSEVRIKHGTILPAAEVKYNQALGAVNQKRDTSLQENQSWFDKSSRDLEDKSVAAWDQMVTDWNSGQAQINGTIQEMFTVCERYFPDFTKTDYASWSKPTTPPGAIQLGKLALNYRHIKHGLSEDTRLHPPSERLVLPALMTLENHPSLVLSGDSKARPHAEQALQAMMLKFLTAIPPGRVRFTILDPIGLGDAFSSFMHLADHDENLINGRIWSSGSHINEQLTRLTHHVETVLQKYLRNQFPTIHDYNDFAGEMAEPYQVLVIANFPVNFSEAAARKLLSILASGAQCGVYTLMSVNTEQPLPHGIQFKHLIEHAAHLAWQPDLKRFKWKFPAFEHLELTLDKTPPAKTLNHVIQTAGAVAKNATRVEVPFASVAPKVGSWWQRSSAKELCVPIGKSGATKIQEVKLGKGTAQHMLISGKTGSGKSTFLHALITNAALYYSPDEVELYLIDFKKGVEFKSYANFKLPHAKVIAIESEREFGLSVLERLDEILRQRGEIFREYGVQDLGAYRNEVPGAVMPRILLVVDEFQELFIEDDKLSQTASLLLDRLVRQGRAFGMHVVLGSQTLAGAYSLARATLGQMAVRIALQCSEADAHLILNDDKNDAALFLSRPGEAIYNDQNGLLNGNQPFQVVWLEDKEKQKYLKNIQQLCVDLKRPEVAPIVFEGNSAADPRTNESFVSMLNDTDKPVSGTGVLRGWVGEPVSIKLPLAAPFARHTGANLLVVGPDEQGARGVLMNAMTSLIAQIPNHSQTSENLSGIILLDGTSPDASVALSWNDFAAPFPTRVVTKQLRQTAQTLEEVSAELTRREENNEELAPPLFLVLYNAGRIRELRRGDDDYGFSFDKEKKISPDKQLAEILRNGPNWGIHLIVWSDSYNNVSRVFDRIQMREFEMRIVFQVSAADSSSLIDSPAATGLKPHRALFYRDDTGTSEKFRPYQVPEEAWLCEIAEKISSIPSQ